MGILDSFEKGLERAVNGAFAKTFRSGLQPVELTSALRRELDTKAAVVTRDRILAPNGFTLRMSPSDHTRMEALGPSLVDELIEYVQQYAREQRYQFAGGLTIELQADGGLSEGMLRVDSENVRREVVWRPVLEINGVAHRLTEPRTVLGRGRDADITVEDTGISRKHLEIVWDGRRAIARDLGSTNGSTLDGARLTKAAIEPDQTIMIGHTRIVFRVLPEAARADPPPAPSDETTRLPGFWSER